MPVRARKELEGDGRSFIVIPELLNQRATRRTRADLAKLGFADTWYVPTGPWAGGFPWASLPKAGLLMRVRLSCWHWDLTLRLAPEAP
ncbi:MAG: hypothetical protein CMQ29_15835 [Gammaproteobacteria bacterium]|nr:hypothetical protein [Gammaproteobacteria bacterium]